MNILFNSSILDNVFDGIYIADKDKNIIYWNKSAESITGYSSLETVGKKYCHTTLMHINYEGDSICKDTCPLDATLKDGQNREAMVYLNHKDGHRVSVSVRITPLLDEKSNTVGAVEIFSTNSTCEQLSVKMQELSNLAMLDTLTGLGNRRFAEKILNAKISDVHNGDSPFGVLFFDIDHFKRVNDEYGHDFGDKVLQNTSTTLVNALRSSDILIRWGGEEIIAILGGICTKEKLNKIANKLRILIEKSDIHTQDGLLSVTASIGATLALPSDSTESLIRRADQLMYQSKAKGRNCVTIG